MNRQNKFDAFFNIAELPGLNLLTPRERDVLELLILGYTAKRSAQSLGISFRTVETHIENVKYKLNCSSKGELLGRLMSSFVSFHLVV